MEIKSFLNYSNTSDFHQATGQYLNYKAILKEKKSERKLFIALEKEVFDKIQESLALRFMIKFHRIYFIVFDPITGEIIQWKN